MKHIKNFFYLVAVLAVLGIGILISTAIVQVTMGVIANGMGILLKEDVLFSVSGSLGIAITGVICAWYVKKKHYTDCVEVREPLQIKKCAYYGAVAFCVCSVLFYAITTFLFVNVLSMTEQVAVVAEKSWMEIFFTILAAPVFEELLFRMGLYSLMRQRFGKAISVLLCTIIFAFMHGYSVQGLLACITGGLVFMLIYVSTGNVWYTIIAHMICNLAATGLNVLETKGVTWLGLPIQYEINGFNTVHPVLIGMAAIFCGFCIIKKVQSVEK